jgi:hypothetical protein
MLICPLDIVLKAVGIELFWSCNGTWPLDMIMLKVTLSYLM